MIVALSVLWSPAPAAGWILAGVQAAAQEAGDQLTPLKAVVLGLVEGITEFLPISSTGHLLVAQRLMGIGTTEATKDAADSYAIAIQAGAILAVAVLYWKRLVSMARGALGHDTTGRGVLLALAAAAVPAAVIGLLGEQLIKDNLLGPGPVIAAWIVGGIVILAVADRWTSRGGGRGLEEMGFRSALVIGLAQCVAMWPGTSRSMVTILAALALGYSLAAAVEFSFLLGLVTLGGATAYEAVRNGSEMLDAYGWFEPILGLVVAFVAAVIAVRWMVGYLQRHSLAIFGWYRLGIAGLALVLLGTGAM